MSEVQEFVRQGARLPPLHTRHKALPDLCPAAETNTAHTAHKEEARVKIYLLWPENCREAMKLKLQYFSRIPADRLGRAEIPKARSGIVQSKVILEKICDNSIFKAVLKGFIKICVCLSAVRRGLAKDCRLWDEFQGMSVKSFCSLKVYHPRRIFLGVL